MSLEFGFWRIDGDLKQVDWSSLELESEPMCCGQWSGAVQVDLPSTLSRHDFFEGRGPH